MKSRYRLLLVFAIPRARVGSVASRRGSHRGLWRFAPRIGFAMRIEIGPRGATDKVLCRHFNDRPPQHQSGSPRRHDVDPRGDRQTQKSPGQLELPRTEIRPTERPYAPDESCYFFSFLGFLAFFLMPAPPGFSLRKPAPPGFSLRKPAPPGFSERWASWMCFAVERIQQRSILDRRRTRRVGRQRHDNETRRSKERIANERLHERTSLGWWSQ